MGKIIQEDKWVWGKEVILWGDSIDHKFTFKALMPVMGRKGVLSLQYHREKEEVWFCYQGEAWVLVVKDGNICCYKLHPGEIQRLEKGIWHRLVSITKGVIILEASSVDKHAADKKVEKDVIRLDCLHGRECIVKKEDRELVSKCRDLTLKTVQCIEQGNLNDIPVFGNKEDYGWHKVFPITQSYQS